MKYTVKEVHVGYVLVKFFDEGTGFTHEMPVQYDIGPDNVPQPEEVHAGINAVSDYVEGLHKRYLAERAGTELLSDLRVALVGETREVKPWTPPPAPAFDNTPIVVEQPASTEDIPLIKISRIKLVADAAS